MRPSDITNLLDTMIKAEVSEGERKDTIMLIGPPGVGKTALPIQAAERNKLFLIFFHPLFSEPIDLTGVPHIVQNGKPDNAKTYWANPGWVPDEVPDGYNGIMCLVDEMSQCDPPMMKACAPICEEHRIGSKYLPKGSIVVATGNRVGDRAGANRMLSHVKSRIVEIPFESSLEDFEAWGMSTGKIIPQVRYFLRWKPGCLNTFKAESEGQYACQRGWHKVSRLYPILPPGLQVETIAGVVGKGESAEFLAFCKVWEELVGQFDPLKILANPEKAKLPNESQVDVLWALAGSIAEAAKKQDIKVVEKALIYFRRMPREFCFVAIQHLTMGIGREKFQQVCRNKEYLAWAKDNQELLVESMRLS